MPIWIRVSSAIEVLSMDIEVLSLHKSPAADAFQSIVDALPDILARRAVRNGWQFPLDTSALSIAAEAAAFESDGLLELHRETAESDLGNLDIVHALSVRLRMQNELLLDRDMKLSGGSKRSKSCWCTTMPTAPHLLMRGSLESRGLNLDQYLRLAQSRGETPGARLLLFRRGKVLTAD
jgi:hypothetical protein